MLNLNRGILVKDLINKYKFAFIFLSIVAMAIFFPLTGKGISLRFFEPDGLRELSEVTNLGIVSNLMSMVLSRIAILKIIIYGFLSTAMFILMKNLVDKKNVVLTVLAGFFFLLLDKVLFASSFVDLSGFTSYFVGALFLLIILNVFIKNLPLTMRRSSLFLLGLVGTSIYPVYAFVFFGSTLLYLFVEKQDRTIKERGVYLLMGELLGMMPLVLSQKVIYSGFSHNLIEGFIPLITETNFIIVLIMVAMVSVGAVKMFTRGRRLKICLAVIGIFAYLIASLSVENNIVKYITFLSYNAGCLYLLLNIKNSVVFNRRIKYYYIFKGATIFYMCIFGNIEVGSLLFLSLVDVLIILELYDSALPKNFLNNVWLCLFVLLATSNIYIYAKTLSKFDEMNGYIKNKLECHRGNYSIPNKYYTEYLYDYIPKSREELEYYILYYDVVLFGELDDIELHFNVNP